jgi:hypothetical protein
MNHLMKAWIFYTHIHHPWSHFYIHPPPFEKISKIKIVPTLLLTSNGCWGFNHNRSKCIKVSLNNLINNLGWTSIFHKTFYFAILKETTNSCMYIVQNPPKGHVEKNKRTSK